MFTEPAAFTNTQYGELAIAAVQNILKYGIQSSTVLHYQAQNVEPVAHNYRGQPDYLAADPGYFATGIRYVPSPNNPLKGIVCRAPRKPFQDKGGIYYQAQFKLYLAQDPGEVYALGDKYPKRQDRFVISGRNYYATGPVFPCQMGDSIAVWEVELALERFPVDGQAEPFREIVDVDRWMAPAYLQITSESFIPLLGIERDAIASYLDVTGVAADTGIAILQIETPSSFLDVPAVNAELSFDLSVDAGAEHLTLLGVSGDIPANIEAIAPSAFSEVPAVASAIAANQLEAPSAYLYTLEPSSTSDTAYEFFGDQSLLSIPGVSADQISIIEKLASDSWLSITAVNGITTAGTEAIAPSAYTFVTGSPSTTSVELITNGASPIASITSNGATTAAEIQSIAAGSYNSVLSSSSAAIADIQSDARANYVSVINPGAIAVLEIAQSALSPYSFALGSTATSTLIVTGSAPSEYTALLGSGAIATTTGLPELPPGSAYLLGKDDSAYLLGADGAYLYGVDP